MIVAARSHVQRAKIKARCALGNVGQNLNAAEIQKRYMIRRLPGWVNVPLFHGVTIITHSKVTISVAPTASSLTALVAPTLAEVRRIANWKKDLKNAKRTVKGQLNVEK